MKLNNPRFAKATWIDKETWYTIFSFTILKLDIIESFKYRKKQTWFFLLAAVTIFSVVNWALLGTIFESIWQNQHPAFQMLLYLPLVASILFWFRGCSISSLWNLDKTTITRKQSRSWIMIYCSGFVFLCYYLFWMFMCMIYRPEF